MCKPELEVADIFRRYAPDYRKNHGGSLSPDQHRVMRAIELCRTAALGGHIDECDHCGQRIISYNSCRNRHCPKCQSLAKAEWLEARQAELLPVEYFHVVFTLPESLASVAFQNKKVACDILFRAASETLQAMAADPKHLGAEIGFLAVLHTWGQNLMYHPHVHCVVPGGGISPDARRWVSCRSGFLFPVRVLSRLFRGKFLAYLKEAFDRGRLEFFGHLDKLRQPAAFSEFLQSARQTEWVVYSKPPFGGPEQVLDYLGHYTHRVAISNHRLISMQDGKVTFRYKDYRHESRIGIMTLEADEFIRRFLLHVLPHGFMRLRYFGFLGNRCRNTKLDACRRLLDVPPSTDPLSEITDWRARYKILTGVSLEICPACHRGRMITVRTMPAPYRKNRHRIHSP